MLDNSHWSKKNEKFIISARDSLIDSVLRAGFDVIVDDTNLDPIHEETIKHKFGKLAEIEVKTFDVPLKECIRRDSLRPNPVGEKVIKKMYYKYLGGIDAVKPRTPTPGLPYAAIFDIDGTLALHNGRSPYDAEKCESDLLNEPVAELLKMVKKTGRKIIIASGRSDKYKPHTMRWLRYHGVEYDELLMRKEGDFRQDAIVKKEILDDILTRYNVFFTVDDRDQVVNMWRENGLTCLQVAPGDF